MIYPAEKKQLRKNMLETREVLPHDVIEEKSRLIITRLGQLPQFLAAKTVLVYIPIKKEVDTRLLIKNSWESNKIVLVPVCQPEKKLLLSELRDFCELETKKYDLQEPAERYIRPVPPREVDIAVIPGVAFDCRGYRLGYGGGYYDRFMGGLRPDCLKIGLAYDFQVLRRLPAEEHDSKMDLLITETRLIL